MKASEFIQKIQSLIDENGDFEVVTSNCNSIGDIYLEYAVVEVRELSERDLSLYKCIEVSPEAAKKHFLID